MRTLSLSGWGQPHDALLGLSPHATIIDYARHGNAQEAFAEIAETGEGCEQIIGWSLGGHLAVRAIADGLLRPKKLVLIATPFQFVATLPLSMGMKRDTYETFVSNYAHNPARTLRKAQALLAKGDMHAEAVLKYVALQDNQALLAKQWLYWLEFLDNTACSAIDFSEFPPTLLLHGEEDAVVAAAQSQYFAERVLNVQLLLWPSCGHAPHWHDSARARAVVEQFLYV